MSSSPMSPSPTRSLSILGAGAWGSALGGLMIKKGVSVTLWNRTPRPGVLSSLKEAVEPQGEVVLAVSVRHVLRVCAALAEENIHPRLCWIASKGLDCATGFPLSRGVQSHFPQATIGIFSGPNIAKELEEGLSAGMTIACEDGAMLRQGRDLFPPELLRIETSHDVVGVQWWGALKNVLAIGYGLLQQSTPGHNMSASFLTLGAQEIAALVEAQGGHRDTALSFAGMGDLILTSHCPAGRNRAYGQYFPREPQHLVEGLDTLRTLEQYPPKDKDGRAIPTPLMDVIGRVVRGSLEISDLPKVVMAL